MRTTLTILYIFSFFLSGRSQDFKLFELSSIVHSFQEVNDGYVTLMSKVNPKDGKPLLNLIKFKENGKLLINKIISDENFSINRYEQMYYDKVKDEIIIVGFRYNQNDSSLIDIIKLRSDLSILNKKTIPLTKGNFYGVVETDLLGDKLLIYGYNFSNVVNKFVIVYDQKLDTYIFNENSNNNTSLNDLILLPEPNQLLLSNFGLSITDYSGNIVTTITDTSIKQVGASNADKFSRDSDSNLLLFSASALVPNIYSNNASLKSIVYKISSNKKVLKWKQIGEERENPCQTKSISVLNDNIFTGSFPFKVPIPKEWTFFRITKLDKDLNIKWTKKITPEFDRLCILLGVEASKDGGCVAYGELLQPGLSIYDPANISTGFMLRFDSLGNIVPFDMTTDVKEVADENLAIYPNPAKNELFIRSTRGNTSADLRIKVYNQVGQLVKDELVNEKINIESLNNGVYLYSITQNEKLVKSGNFIKTD